MKKLYIIRHAKSSWKDMSLVDFDRPLNKRGKRNAPFMGAKLRQAKVKPDIILSSPALRAKITAQIIAKEVEYAKNIIFNKTIYDANVDTIHKILRKIDSINETAFLFGHNTNLEILAEYYVKFDENIPTCGIVEIEFDCKKWSDISAKNATLISFDYPKKELITPICLG